MYCDPGDNLSTSREARPTEVAVGELKKYRFLVLQVRMREQFGFRINSFYLIYSAIITVPVLRTYFRCTFV